LDLRRSFLALQQQKRQRARRAAAAVPALDLYNGLGGYWGLEELSGTRQDSFINGVALHPYSGTYPVDGVIGGGLLGNAAYFPMCDVPWSEAGSLLTEAGGEQLGGPQLGSPHLAITANGWTISAWVNVMMGSLVEWHCLFGKFFTVWLAWNDQTERMSVCFWEYGNPWAPELFDGPDDAAFTMTIWQHVVLVLDGMDFTVFLNGQPYFSGTRTVALNTDGELWVGGDGLGNGLCGYVDEVGVWQRALTADEVLALYNVGEPLPLNAFGA
jgi:hypothetical protein